MYSVKPTVVRPIRPTEGPDLGQDCRVPEGDPYLSSGSAGDYEDLRPSGQVHLVPRRVDAVLTTVGRARCRRGWRRLLRS